MRPAHQERRPQQNHALPLKRWCLYFYAAFSIGFEYHRESLDQAEQLNKDIKTYNQKKETFVEAIKEYQKQIQMLSAKREIPAQ